MDIYPGQGSRGAVDRGQEPYHPSTMQLQSIASQAAAKASEQSKAVMQEVEEQHGPVVTVKLPYGYARALLQRCSESSSAQSPTRDVWYYAACDALSAAGSRKTYTSNKVCLWKQKPENVVAFGNTGKIIKLDRQNVYCLRLDGITKLLKDKGLGCYVQYFEHHEEMNPPHTEGQDGNRTSQSNKRSSSVQYVVSPEDAPHNDHHVPTFQVSHVSHAWTVFNPVTGVLLHAAMCASCGVQDMRPAAALQCPLAGVEPLPGPRTVALMERQFKTLMEEMQAHFLLMEDQFKDLTKQLKSHFLVAQQQFDAIVADHERQQIKLRKSRSRGSQVEAKRPRKRRTPDEREMEQQDACPRSSSS